MSIEHKDITDPNIHETKGAATATDGQVLTATGLGTAIFKKPVKVGLYNYGDTATTTVPIALTVAGTLYDLTNDTVGASTNLSYALADAPSIWNSTTNRFDFSTLTLGDSVDIQVDLSYVTTGANTAVTVLLEVATGTGSVFTIPIINGMNIKTAGTNQISGRVSLGIVNDTIRLNPSRIRAKADATGSTVIVNNWNVRVVKRGE
jgi:hypothetical protein